MTLSIAGLKSLCLGNNKVALEYLNKFYLKWCDNDLVLEKWFEMMSSLNFDNQGIDYIKRLIGLPGDRVQFIDANLYLNNSEIMKSKVKNKTKINCGSRLIDVYRFEEKLPN